MYVDSVKCLQNTKRSYKITKKRVNISIKIEKKVKDMKRKFMPKKEMPVNKN